MKNKFGIIALILLFQALFYETRAGLNYLCFALAMTGVLSWAFPALLRRTTLRWLMGGWLLSAVAVIVHHSLISEVVYWLAFVLSWGYTLRTPSRFWLFGILESISSFFTAWWYALMGESWWTKAKASRSGWAVAWRQVRLFSVPCILLTPFYFLYHQASSGFQELGQVLSEWVTPLLTFNFNRTALWHLLLATLLVTAALGGRIGHKRLRRLERLWSYKLRRKRRPSFGANFNGLRMEYRMAMLSLGALNALLLLINLIDIGTVWVAWEPRSAQELSEYVHAGTWLLLLSIALAIGVVVFFLRGNLNFYPQQRALRRLVYFWLGQNAFLALSVGMRNWHYIDAYQLAHGRIVVFFFILLCGYGLYSVYRKVAGPRTTYFLVQYNGWAIGVAILLSCAVNWDSFITNYNLRHGSTDYYYLQTQLHNNLSPTLKHWEQQDEHGRRQWSKELLVNRCQQAIRNHEAFDWRSWNWSDYQQYRLAQAWLTEHNFSN